MGIPLIKFYVRPYITQVYFFQIDAQLGDPTFSGKFKMCRFRDIGEYSNSYSCSYICKPAPDYCVALYVSVRNIESYVRLCEITYFHL